MRDRIATGQAQFRRTHHQLGQSRLRPHTGDADRVDAVTYVTASHEEWDGRQRRAHLRYIDVVIRSAGEWLLGERRVHAAVIEGRPNIDWVWVERRLP